MSELQIEYRSPDDLSKYENNTRVHSPAQIQQLCDIIQEVGFNNPILIDENSIIIAGHGRLAAARKLGLPKVPTIKLAGLTEAQKKAYAIADNKLALNSSWNQDLLKVELASLTGADFSLEVTGFDFRELDSMKVFELDIPGVSAGDGDDSAADDPVIGWADDGIVPLNKGKDKGRPAKTAPLVSFDTYRIPVQDHEMESLKALLKQYEDTYGLHQGFIGWLCDRG